MPRWLECPHFQIRRWWSKWMSETTMPISRDPRRPGIRLLERCALLRGSTGGSIIEIALMVPVFTVLIVGSAEFAGVEYAAIETSNAARAGVAYGAQSSATAADTAGMQSAAINDS